MPALGYRTWPWALNRRTVSWCAAPNLPRSYGGAAMVLGLNTALARAVLFFFNDHFSHEKDIY
jgi:hypothetical protein